MSVTIQSVTYSGLHPVPVTRQACRRGRCISSNSAVKAPHCSISRFQDEDDGCSSVNYGACGTQWMNGCYMDLKMRSNPLLNAEASYALHQHFQHADKTSFQIDAAEHNSSSIHDQIVTRHSSLQPSQGESYGISGLVVFDKSMFGQLDGSSFTEQYGYLVNGFNSGITSFMDEPFC